LVVLALSLFKLVRSTHDYQKTDYYKRTMLAIDSIQLETPHFEQVSGGWAKANITPSYPCRIIGFGIQQDFERVYDSLYVKAFVFSQGEQKFAYLNYDLLLVHPAVQQTVESQLANQNLQFKGIFYSATHTHNGYGGFARAPIGQVLLGKRDDSLINMIASQSVKAIKQALASQENLKYAYVEADGQNYVYNRATNMGGIDPLIRVNIFKKASGEKAVLFSFAAHAASLASQSSDNLLSGDYPAHTSRLLEEKGVCDFASFSAGGVASHNPCQESNDTLGLQMLSDSLSYIIQKKIKKAVFKPLTEIQFEKHPVYLNKSQLRILRWVALQSWVYNFCFSENHPELKYLQFNNTYIVGTPCDFSGEIGLAISRRFKKVGKNIMVTSFNGEYIGYITPDEYYNTVHHREQYELNWYGYGNGSYFEEMISKMLEKL